MNHCAFHFITCINYNRKQWDSFTWFIAFESHRNEYYSLIHSWMKWVCVPLCVYLAAMHVCLYATAIVRVQFTQTNNFKVSNWIYAYGKNRPIFNRKTKEKKKLLFIIFIHFLLYNFFLCFSCEYRFFFLFNY